MAADGDDISLCCDSRISFISFWFLFSAVQFIGDFFEIFLQFHVLHFLDQLCFTLTDLSSSSRSVFSLSSRSCLALRALISSFLDFSSTVNSWFCYSSFSRIAFCSTVISLFFSSICFLRGPMSSVDLNFVHSARS